MTHPVLLAQISDLHMGPVPFPEPRHWNVKRALGLVNWHGKRRSRHSAETLARIMADLVHHKPDHIAVTGDLVNVGLPREYEAATRWLERLGPPENVTAVPGNHDIYTTLRSDPGCARWRPWMGGEVAPREPAWRYPAAFPFVKRVGGVALVGLNSAIPTPPMVAVGELGREQIERTARLLETLGRDGLMRVVLIHHPPLPGLAHHRKALQDAAAFTAMLEATGAELVVYGHNHKAQVTHTPGPGRAIPVVGAPSGSLGRPYKSDTLARYHLYRLTPGQPVELVARGLREPLGSIVEIERRSL